MMEDSAYGGPPFDPVPGSNRMEGRFSGHVLQAGSIHGDIHLHTSAAEGLSRPRQLLPAPRHFTDRELQLRSLANIHEESAASGRTALILVTGLGGIGKSTLALNHLHRYAGRFPDGQLYSDLSGFSGEAPVSPSDTLYFFLRSLGLAPDSIPPGLSERSALFRSITAGRRLAILLDDAATAAQVRPLLPGEGGHMVVVTSRLRLAGLVIDGARIVEVPPLPEESAIALLERLLQDERTRREPKAARDLVSLCGRHPVTLCAAANRLVLRPLRPLRDLVSRLRAEDDRLTTFGEREEQSLRAVLDLSVELLPGSVQQLYRGLGTDPGPDFSTDCAAAIMGRDDVAEELDILLQAHLIQDSGENRFRFHDLVRMHARGQAREKDSPQDRNLVQDRRIGFYLHGALVADHTIRRYSQRGTHAVPPPRTPAFESPNEALTWLDTERANFLALIQSTVEDRPEACHELAMALWPLFLHHSYLDTWLEVDEAALRAARYLGDADKQAHSLARSGLALLEVGDHHAADQRFEESQRLWADLGNTRRQASSLRRRGMAAAGAGDPETALDHLQEALTLYHSLDRPRDIALTLLETGRTLLLSDRPAAAREQLQKAAELLDTAVDPHNLARVHILLGRTHFADDPGAAAAHLESALRTEEQQASLTGQAEAREALGDLARQQGRTGLAHSHYSAAIEALHATGRAKDIQRVMRSRGRLGPKS